MKYLAGFMVSFILMASVNMYCVNDLTKRADALEVEYDKHLATKMLQLEIATERNQECRYALENVLDALTIEPRPIYIED